jgi:hypothetical protein
LSIRSSRVRRDRSGSNGGSWGLEREQEGSSIEYAFVVRISRVRRYVMAEIAKELAVMDQWEQGRREGEEVQSRGMLRVFTVLMGLRRKKRKIT